MTRARAKTLHYTYRRLTSPAQQQPQTGRHYERAKGRPGATGWALGHQRRNISQTRRHRRYTLRRQRNLAGHIVTATRHGVKMGKWRRWLAITGQQINQLGAEKRNRQERIDLIAS